MLLYDEALNQWNQVPYRLDDTSKTIISNGMILGITEDTNGKIWIGSRLHGLVYYDEKDSSLVPAKIAPNSINFTLPENHITNLYSDITNTLWITTLSGIYKYNQLNNELRVIKEYHEQQYLVWNNWNSMLKDKSGNIWITNNFRGILKFDGISDDYSEINIAGRVLNKDGISSLVLTDSAIDETGILWFGSTIEGILKYDPSREPFVNYTYDETDKNSISSNQIFGLLESKADK